MSLTDTEPKRVSVVLLCLTITAGCWIWIVLGQRTGLKTTLRQHEGLGEVMAEETTRLLGRSGTRRIVVVAPDIADPALSAQLRVFQGTLKRSKNFEIEERVLLKPDEQHRSAPGAGLSSKRFVEIVKRHPKADAIVSFAGVPNPEHAEMKGLELKGIRFIAEARQPLDRVNQLFDRGALDVAIVPRFTFPAPSAKHRKTPHEWFDTYFQVLRRNQ